MTAFEQAMMGAVVSMAAAVVAMWKIYTRREDKIHERCRTERAEDHAELHRTRKEFTAVLIELAGMQVPEDRTGE